MKDYRHISIYVTPEQHKKIKMLATETERTIKDLVIDGIERIVKDYGDKQEYEKIQ